MYVVFIPASIRTALKAAGESDKALFCLSTLSSTLSPEDVAFYIHTNLSPVQDQCNPIPENVRASLPNRIVDKLPEFFQQIDQADAPAHLKEIKRLVNEFSLNGTSLKFHDMKLTCELLDEQTVCFTDAPADAQEAFDGTPAGQYALYDRIVQLLHAFLSFEELAKLPLFAGFLKASQAELAPAA